MIPFITSISEWSIFKTSKEEIDNYLKGINIKRPLKQSLMRREIKDIKDYEDFLSDDLSKLLNPFLLKDMDKAIDIFLRSFKNGEKIRIFGDYDADGITATSILVRFIKELGGNVDYSIPNRLEDGYGISDEGLNSAKTDGISLAITVDCGISEMKKITEMKKQGLSVIISDHHTVPKELPPADAIINPMNPQCNYPCKYLSGVGIAFKFICAVCQKLNKPFPKKYLIPTAVGLIGDLMPAKDEVRIILKNAISIINAGNNDWKGIESLINYSTTSKVTSRTIGYSICPKINASGRIGDASISVKLLLSQTEEEADNYLNELIEMNKTRQKIEEKMRKTILFKLQDSGDLINSNVIAEAGDYLHVGVLGITASKLAETFKMPVFLCALTNGIGRGSARAYGGYNIHSILEKNSDILESYGGHVQAGGFSIKEENFPIFKERIKNEEPEKEADKFISDGEMSFSELTLEATEELLKLEPYGKDNEEPVFLFKNVKFTEIKKASKNTLIATIEQNGIELKGIAFGKAELADSIKIDDLKYDIFAYPYVNEFNGTKSVNLELSSILQAEQVVNSIIEEKIKLPEKTNAPIISDSSKVINKMKYLKYLSNISNCLVLVRTKAVQKTILDAVKGTNTKVKFIKDIDQKDIFDDIIFFHPPATFDLFSISIFKKAKRIHFLFSEEDIENEKQFYKKALPSINSITKIFNILKDNKNIDKEKILELITSNENINYAHGCFALELLSENEMLKEEEITLDFIKSSDIFSRLQVQSKKFLKLAEIYYDSFEKFSNIVLKYIMNIENCCNNND